MKWMQLFDAMYISDSCELAIIIQCEIFVVVVAHKLYVNPYLLVFLSDNIFALPDSMKVAFFVTHRDRS